MAKGIIIAIWVMASSLGYAFDQKGGPQKVTCWGKYSVAKDPIERKTDINELLDGHKDVAIDQINPDCHKFKGEVVTCEAIMSNEKLYMRYSFNTQNGGLSIEDQVTGQSTWAYWTNQHKVTKSGYLTVGASLTNTSGGLMGDPKVFQIDFNCQALPKDW